MKKNFKKLGLKILAGLLLCSCISGSKTMAMETDGNGSKKSISRQQRRAAERQAKKQQKKEQQKKEQKSNSTPYTPEFTHFCHRKGTEALTDFFEVILKARFSDTNRQERRKQENKTKADFNTYLVRERYMKERIANYYKIECTDKSPLTVEFITGKCIVVNSIEDIEHAINQNTPDAVSKAENYIKSQGTTAPDFVPICRIKYSVFYIRKADGMAFADSQYTCAEQAKILTPIMVDPGFLNFLEKEDRKPLVEQMFPKKKSDRITLEELPHVVKAKQDEAKVAEEEKDRKAAKEQAEAEERKERMAECPPDYNTSSLDEFSMMISDEKLQEMRKAFEESDKAWLAKKMDQKRPKSYFPEAKERTDMVEIETNSSQIPINYVRDLAPYCSTEHKAFFSLCEFLKENPDLEKQTLEVCEQIVNCFGKAQCPVTKLKGGLVIFETEDGTCDRTNAFEAYINDRYRVIFILHPEKGILFTDFGVHTI